MNTMRKHIIIPNMLSGLEEFALHLRDSRERLINDE